MNKTPLEEWILQKATPEGRDPLSMTRADLESYQLNQLRETLQHAQENSAFYREILKDLRMDAIDSVNSLQQLPFTTAVDISRRPEGFLCCSQDDVERIVTMESSGTTGNPKRIFFTEDDQELTRDFFHHALSVVAKPGDTVLVMLPGQRPGSVGDLFARSARRLGVKPVPYGFVADPEDALRVMEQEGVNLLLGTPVQVLALATWESPASPKFSTRVENVIVNMDNLPKSIKQRIYGKWKARVFNHYAMTEMGLGGGLECEAMSGYHLREADLLFEVVHPVTGEVLPDGEEGEVVFTTLTRSAMPLIRYRTGDLSRFVPEACQCGTLLKRLDIVRDRVDGRIQFSDGQTLSQSILDEELFAVDGVINCQGEVVSDRHGNRLQVQVQAAPWAAQDLAEVLAVALQSIPEVASLVDTGELRVDSVIIDRSTKLWPPRKRVLLDKRNGEEWT